MKMTFYIQKLTFTLLIFMTMLMTTDTPANANETHPRNETKILEFIEKTRKKELEDLCSKAKINYPPQVVSLRIYKQEKTLELWASDDPEALVHLTSFEICAMDFEPGPKLQEGDKRTPEGSYNLKPYFNSKNWFMWINLNPEKTRFEGEVGQGSAFYLCTDYPQKPDRERSKSIGIKNPGSAICIHGNCVSAGCPSLRNEDFVKLFYFTMKHNTPKYGPPQVHIFPFRFDRSQNIEEIAQKSSQHNKNTKKLGSKRILSDWLLLQELDQSFLKSPRLKPIVDTPNLENSTNKSNIHN